MPPRSTSLLPLLLAISLSTAARAAEPGPFELGTIVVTADVDEPLTDTISSHITAADIRRFERTDLAEALRLSPGVVQSNVGPRNEAGVYVRGFDLRQVPVFVDGIPVYVPYDGYVDLRRFTTADVADIRVSKGFSSAVHGPNTLGGAINVVTRKPTRPMEGDFLAGWFQEGGVQTAANLGILRDHWYLQLGGSFLDAQSYPLSDDFRPRPGEDGGQRDNAWRQDWRVSAKLGFTPNETDEYALGYLLQRGEKGNPVYAGRDSSTNLRYWQWPIWDKQTVYYIGNTHLAPDTYIKQRLYWDQFQNSLFAYDDSTYSTQRQGSSFRSHYDDYTLGGSLEFGTRLSENNTLKAAAHGKFDHHTEQNDGERKYTFEDMTWSFGIEDTQRFTERFSVVAGLSYDRRDVQEAVDTNTGSSLGGNAFDALNPQLGFFYEVPEHGTFHLTGARKSRFPTIKDRYSYRLGQAIPNPDLEPETAWHADFGYDGKLGKELTFSASLFYSGIEDTIQRVDNVRPGLFQLQNVGRSRHLGADLSLDWEPHEAFQFGVTYSYLDRKNQSQPDVKLIDTPKHALFSYAEIKPVSWLSIIPSVEYGGDRYSTTYGMVSGAYTVANLKVSVRLSQDVTLSAGVNNLFDRDYTLTEGFPEAGRNAFVNCQIKF